MVSVYNNPNSGRTTVFKDCLANSCCPVYEYHIIFCKAKPSHHIACKLCLGIQHLILKSIADRIISINHLLIGQRTILIEVASAIKVCPAIQRRIVFRIDFAVSIIILPYQAAVTYQLHPVYQFICLIGKINCIILFPIFKDIPAAFAFSGKYRILLCKAILQITFTKGNRSHLHVCKKCIEPYNLFVRKIQIACHMLNIFSWKHIRKNKSCRNPRPSEQVGTVALSVLHTAARPADSQIKIINHSFLLT